MNKERCGHNDTSSHCAKVLLRINPDNICVYIISLSVFIIDFISVSMVHRFHMGSFVSLEWSNTVS